MNTIKIIKIFCVVSVFSGFLYGQEDILTGTLANQAAPVLSVPQQNELTPEQQSMPEIVPAEQLALTPIEPEAVAMPESQTPTTAETKAPEVAPVTKIEPAVGQVAMPPSVPITRVIAPGQTVPELSPKLKGKSQISLKDQSAKPQQEYSQEQQKEDAQALEDLAARSQDMKRHLSVPPPDDSDERIEFQFENTDLSKVIQQVGDLYNVTFIPDDIISPLPQGSVATVGNKISFRTQKGMTKKQAWNLFLNFLDIAGFAVVPEKSPRRYRIISLQKALKAPVPSYIGVDPKTLPDNDQVIRFVYFVENGNMAVIQSVVDKLRSSTSELLSLGDAKAFILTDKAYNIKTLMVIVKELDRVSMPQSMSVMKLYRADAKDVAKLFDQLMGTEENKQQPIYMPRQQPTALYFPQNTRLIAESRTNSLIILGTPDSIEKIESFIRKNVDKDPEAPHSPLFYYDLKFADAKTVEKILNDTVGKFGTETEAGKVGGIRGTDKYVRHMTFIADQATNRIIMKGDYQDYVMVKDLIFQIDQPQPQVAIEVLVLYVSWSKVKKLGTQIRNYMKECGGFGSDHVQFQTSGLDGRGIVERKKPSLLGSDLLTIPNRLMGNLLNLVSGLEAGNTIITLGRDIFGVWGVLRMLESFAAAETVANPFLMASNKQTAIVKVGETRRVVTAEIVQTSGEKGTMSYDDMDAFLTVKVTPQINSDGMITLDILVSIQTFLAGFTAENAGLRTREIQTKAIVADREVLALGGLIKNNSTQDQAKVPGLGDVPILGWLFKNESKTDERDCLLILFSTQIIDPLMPEAARRFTQHHIDDYYGTLDSMQYSSEKHDPIYRMFFEEDKKSVGNRVQDFIFEKPKKRTKSGTAELEALKKEHPVLADQPEVLEAMNVDSEGRAMKGSVDSQAEVKTKKASIKAAKNPSQGKCRAKVSLTDDTLENAGAAA